MYGRRELTKTVHDLSIRWSYISNMRPDLVGICPIASCVLYQAMSIIDRIYHSTYHPHIFWGRSKNNASHCWVESGERVYDPTFIQFAELCPIYIGPITEAHEPFLHDVKEITSLSDFRSWDEWQAPTQKRMNWFLHNLFQRDKNVMKNRNGNFTFNIEQDMSWK
jgi:hypothetical protein